MPQAAQSIPPRPSAVPPTPPGTISRRGVATLEDARRSFLRMVSHELRTPLNSIIGFSEIIACELYGPLGAPQYREYADLVRESGLKMLALVNQVLEIIRLESAYQMCTKRECYDALIRVASTPVKPNLTGVMLEVLSIIAYRQPVTRAEIERIRGVSSDYAVNRLLDYGLIEEDGRAETIGRPILFKTTEAFLRQFGLSSAEDLPEIDEMIQDQAKENAYLEAGVTEEERKKLEEPEGEESSDMTAETDEHPEAERPEADELSEFDEHSETEAGSGAEGDPENNTDDASEEGSGLTGHLIPKSDDAE